MALPCYSGVGLHPVQEEVKDYGVTGETLRHKHGNLACHRQAWRRTFFRHHTMPRAHNSCDSRHEPTKQEAGTFWIARDTK